ncbi:hypothetical protein [Corynebacterium suranareeae]|uniref:hypothetical protein n=1 Tax=Corynebacterium suranareeae TaxID=2506452 RepID=UPI0012FD73C2|nr:hypothetical protein [Corynebacterium suranareeae]
MAELLYRKNMRKFVPECRQNSIPERIFARSVLIDAKIRSILMGRLPVVTKI